MDKAVAALPGTGIRKTGLRSFVIPGFSPTATSQTPGGSFRLHWKKDYPRHLDGFKPDPGDSSWGILE